MSKEKCFFVAVCCLFDNGCFMGVSHGAYGPYGAHGPYGHYGSYGTHGYRTDSAENI